MRTNCLRTVVECVTLRLYAQQFLVNVCYSLRFYFVSFVALAKQLFCEKTTDHCTTTNMHTHTHTQKQSYIYSILSRLNAVTRRDNELKGNEFGLSVCLVRSEILDDQPELSYGLSDRR